MGILDFLSKKSPAAPAPAGATESTAAPADALKGEIVNHGLDASRINIAVDGSTVTLTGGAATTADAEKIALAVGNTKGVTKVVNNIVADAPHQKFGLLHRQIRRHALEDRRRELWPRPGREIRTDFRGQLAAAEERRIRSSPARCCASPARPTPPRR